MSAMTQQVLPSPPPVQPPGRSGVPRWVWVIIAALAVLVVILVVALAATAGGRDAKVIASATASSTARSHTLVPPPQASTPPPPSPTPAPQIAHFGQEFVYTDGVAVTVGTPEPYTPSQSAAGVTPGKAYLKVTVTVRNGTPGPWDPSAALVDMQAGGTEGREVFDVANGLEGGPRTAVLPGQSVSWVTAFAVDGTSSPVVQVAPGFQYKAALFTG